MVRPIESAVSKGKDMAIGSARRKDLPRGEQLTPSRREVAHSETNREAAYEPIGNSPVHALHRQLEAQLNRSAITASAEALSPLQKLLIISGAAALAWAAVAALAYSVYAAMAHLSG